MVAGQLGVTHFLIFSRTEKNVNLRISRVPRGPTLTFRVAEYALAKDCLALQKNPKTSDVEYHKSPLLVLNNFQQPGKEFKVMTVMLQNMFPSVDVQTVSVSFLILWWVEYAISNQKLKNLDAIIRSKACIIIQL